MIFDLVLEPLRPRGRRSSPEVAVSSIARFLSGSEGNRVEIWKRDLKDGRIRLDEKCGEGNIYEEPERLDREGNGNGQGEMILDPTGTPRCLKF